MRFSYKVAILSALVMASCGGGGDDSPPAPTPTPEQIVPDPTATTLVFPDNNTECNEGEIIDEFKSRVTFRWNAAADTDSYEVNIRDLNTDQSIVNTVSATEATIQIDRGAPYEWFVVSKATGTTVTASSSTFKFYNQGPGIENYAPFPAEAVNPARGADLTQTAGSVALSWNGTDIDNDIAEYEVFFGTAEIPTESLGTTTEETMDATVTIGTIYYWRVLSVDSEGNSSQSEIFEFKVSS